MGRYVNLILMADPNYETGDEEGSGAQQVEYTRAANGDFLIERTRRKFFCL